jgi:gluconokinase
VQAIIVMGVTGSGKSTVGRRLAAALGWRFIDADVHHPPTNVAKLRAGVPLTEADREPWLAELHGLLRAAVARGEAVVLACSALRARYRALLRQDLPGVAFVYLRADAALLASRLAGRQHFVNPVLLPSQLATLEEPRDELTVDADLPPDEIVGLVCSHFGL